MKKIIHFDGWLKDTACGLKSFSNNPLYTTTHCLDVDCENCKRTNRFKKWKAIQEERSKK